MNNLKSNPKGIDIEINSIQTKLYNKLGYSAFDGYGRVYLIDGKPKFFVNGSYKEVLLDDKLNGHFFFIEDSNTKKDSIFETDVDIIFLLDLEKIKPNVNHRADEEVRVEILEVLEKCRRFHLEEITKGIDALNDFEHTLIDMQPFHFISLKGNLQYCI